MLTCEELAARLGVTPARVRQLAIAGRIAGARRFGPAWMFPTNARVTNVRMGRPKGK